MDGRAIKLATAILLTEGEISLTDIEALPFVEDRELAREIAESLRRRFDTNTAQRRISGASGAAGLEDVIVLRSPQTKSEFEAMLRRVSRPRTPVAASS